MAEDSGHHPGVGDDELVRLCRDTAAALSEAVVRTEALAEFLPATKRLVIFRGPATMRPLGEVWRLGVLLLATDASLWAAGSATRSRERGREGYQSQSLEHRRDIAAAALRGGYSEGTVVNYDATPLPLDTGAIQALGGDSPLGFSDGRVRVRWRAGAQITGAVTLEQYLHERSELLIHPPLAAT
ncbi:MAG: hypothetical protein GX862_07725 [Leucobacter sp.]|nr:hypothetical protein [Leucobacter sp.]